MFWGLYAALKRRSSTVLHARCCTHGAARTVLHAWCCTHGAARMVLHAWCCTHGAARTVLHAFVGFSAGSGGRTLPEAIYEMTSGFS
jgi:hypothetical protein